MPTPIIDCDVHPMLANARVLLPYLDAYWQDQVTTRGLNIMDVATYRASLPLTARADWRNADGRAASTVTEMAAQLLDPLQVQLAICNVVHIGQSVFNPHFAIAACKATNDWLAREWLDRDDRLRASIVIPIQDIEASVAEIERVAADKRFVQVLLPIGGDTPFGRKPYWPIYRAAEKHGLPVAIHPGGGGRYPQSYNGYHTYYSEDYVLQASMLQGQILSLIYEGVLTECPGLNFVILESGCSWLPSFMVDADNKWMALRREVPWVKAAPSELIQQRFRFSTQPFDVPAGSDSHASRIIEMVGSEEIFLFASDYPHWQFEGLDAFPAGLSDALKAKIAHANALTTYPRLQGALQ